MPDTAPMILSRRGLLVVHDRGCRSGKRAKHGDRHSGLAAWRVDGPLDRGFERTDSGRFLPPGLEALAPQVGGPLGVFLRCSSLTRRVSFIDPGSEVRCPKRWEGQQQISQVALRIDGDDRNTVERGLFESASLLDPVFPLPVIPTQTAWVVRSFAS